MEKLFIVSFILTFCFPLYGMERGFFGQEVIEDKVIIVKEQGLRLKTNALIRADKIIFKGPIITEGYKLELDVRDIVIESSDKEMIIGFDDAAPAMTYIPEKILTIPPKAGRVGRNGAKGARGYKGMTGETGINGRQDSKEIIISFSSISGVLRINANGEKGGRGGKGGQGGQGGLGGDGANGWAKVSCGDDKGEAGGNAGAGGDAGLGGDGGIGGVGGNQILVTVNTKLNDWKNIIFITSKHGEGGDGGDVGEYGAVGQPGNAGPGASDKGCVTDSHSVPGGAPSTEGVISESRENKDKRKGKRGSTLLSDEVPPIVLDINELVNLKNSVNKSFVDFNLLRYQHKSLLELVSYISGRKSVDLNQFGEEMLAMMKKSFENADLNFIERIKKFLSLEYIEEIKASLAESSSLRMERNLKALLSETNKTLELLNYISTGNLDRSEKILDELFSSSLFRLENALDEVSDLCLDYNLVENITFHELTPNFIASPVCSKYGVVTLRNNIFSMIEVNKGYKPTLAPSYIEESLIVDKASSLNVRTPSNIPYINTVVINNRRLDDLHYKVSLDKKVKDVTVISYDFEEKSDVTEDKIYNNFKSVLGLKVNQYE